MQNLKITEKKTSDLIPYENNPRNNDEAVEYVKNSIKQFGFKVPIILDKDNVIIAGHTRLKAAKELGMETVPCIMADDLTPEQVKAFRLADNKVSEFSYWDFSKLDNELNNLSFDFDMNDFGFNTNIENDMKDDDKNDDIKQSLKERFLFTPTSVLNSRSGEWLNRKKQWVKFGIKSETSRQNMKTTGNEAGSIPRFYEYKEKCQKRIGKKISSKEFIDKYLPLYLQKDSLIKTTDDGGILSIFDPVLCELMYYWFSFEKAHILDPFAGGSVRGIVASKLRMNYTGIDLRQEQIDENKKQAETLLDEQDATPTWICGNSLYIDNIAKGSYDFIFSCPPYFDLEKYSDNEEDLSNQNYADFCDMYQEIIAKSVDMLKEDRFAVFVIGDVRDKKTGMYRNLVSKTIECFINAGMQLYNEIILVTQIGSLAQRVGRQFSNMRKVGKTHQNVLVFYKGDPRKIKQIYGKIEFLELDEENNNNGMDI